MNGLYDRLRCGDSFVLLFAGLPISVDSNVCVYKKLTVVRNCSLIHFAAITDCDVKRVGVANDSLSEYIVADVISLAKEIDRLCMGLNSVDIEAYVSF